LRFDFFLASVELFFKSPRTQRLKVRRFACSLGFAIITIAVSFKFSNCRCCFHDDAFPQRAHSDGPEGERDAGRAGCYHVLVGRRAEQRKGHVPRRKKRATKERGRHLDEVRLQFEATVKGQGTQKRVAFF
jgi:hypothetical protein